MGEPMSYIVGMVTPVPIAEREAYMTFITTLIDVFRDHGALSGTVAWGDAIPEGKLTSYPQAVQLQPGETVVFSWIEWPSREAREDGTPKALADPRSKEAHANVRHDGKRMLMGGFEVVHQAGSVTAPRSAP